MSPRGGKRERAGRKPAEDAPTDHLHVRVSPARLAAYKEAAARKEQTLSEWVQVHLDMAAEVTILKSQLEEIGERRERHRAETRETVDAFHVNAPKLRE